MKQYPDNNLTRWLAGIVGAFISGGSASISSGVAAMGIAPTTFNFGTGLGHTMKLALATFLFAGVTSLAKYLSTHPVPDGWAGDERRNATVTVTVPVAPAPLPAEPFVIQKVVEPVTAEPVTTEGP